MHPRSLLLGCDLAQGTRDLVPGRVYAFGTYFPKSTAMHWDSSWSQMVLDVKHGDAWATAQAGKIIAGHLNSWLSVPGPYVLTPVPRSPRCLKPTAAERLAPAIRRHIAPYIDVTVEPLLTMSRAKQRQQHDCLSPPDRAANVRGCYAFAGWPEQRPATILLLDDIVTSGATLQECSRVLGEATGLKVIALAMARTVQR
jgi:predicted amidophosphoribosyltransferase